MELRHYSMTLYHKELPDGYFVSANEEEQSTRIVRGGEPIGGFSRMMKPEEALKWLQWAMRQDLGKEIEFWKL